MQKNIRRILAIRNDRFGELLLNIPALRALKETYPQAELSVAVSSVNLELAGLIDCVDRVLDWELIKNELRKYKFDMAVVLNPSKEAHWGLFWSGIPVRAGYNRKWGIFLTHKIEDTKDKGNRHEVECNLELAGVAGAQTNDKALSLRVNENLFKYFINQDIVIVHPFTSDPVKQWPLERFAELARRIRGELGLKVVIAGNSAQPFEVGDTLINMVNKTSLIELAALLKRGILLVSADSGPVHLAASVGTPVIALFRNDLPGKTARRWGPWGEGHLVIEKNKLNDISVDEVLEAVRKQCASSIGRVKAKL